MYKVDKLSNQSRLAGLESNYMLISIALNYMSAHSKITSLVQHLLKMTIMGKLI